MIQVISGKMCPQTKKKKNQSAAAKSQDSIYKWGIEQTGKNEAGVLMVS